MKNFFCVTNKNIFVLFVSLVFVFSVIVVMSGVARAAAPVIAWVPSNASRVSDSATAVTATFDQVIYKDSTCANVVDDAHAANIARLRVGSTSGPIIQSTITVSNLSLLINPDSDLSDGTYYAVITDGWYYKDADDNSACRAGSSGSVYFFVDTTPPTIDSPVSFSSSSSRDGWAKEGETITTSFSFSEKVDYQWLDISYQVGNGSEDKFIFTDESAIDSGECKEVNTQTHTYQCNYVVLTQDDGLFKVKINSFSDLAQNSGTGDGHDSYNDEGITVDTTIPSVIETRHYAEYTDESNLFSREVTGGTFKNGETIYTKVLFSENMAHTTGAVGTRAFPRITYSIGNTRRIYGTASSHSAVLQSGQCKPNHDIETDEYVCRYTVGSFDNGEFRVVVDAASIDAAGNAIAEEYVHTVTVHPIFDTARPDRPTNLDLADAHDTGQDSEDNLTSVTRGLSIRGCAEGGSTVTLQRNGTDISGTVVADGSADSLITCTGAGVSSFSKDIDLSEGEHLITATATDAVDQISLISSSLRIVVDETAPVLESATITNFEKTKTILSFSEPVFTTEVPSVHDFVLTDSNLGSVTISAVVGATGTDTPERTITLTHTAFSLLSDVTFAYVPGVDENRRISDRAGNVLETIPESSSVAISASGLLTVSLHPSNDTGVLNDDRITNFQNNQRISFVVARTVGNFGNGDIKLYKVRENGTTRIGSQRVFGNVSSVTVQLVRGHFIQDQNLEDGVTIVASFTPTNGSESAPSEPLVIYYDTIAPTLTEVNAVPALSNDILPEYTFSANETGTLRYEGACRPTETDAEIGDNIISLGELREGRYSDCRVYVTDVAGNESAALRVSGFEIDTTEPTISSASLIRLAGTKTLVTFSEPVYAESIPDARDFSVVGEDGIEHFGTGIDGLANTADTATNSFVLNHSAVDTSGTILFSYSQSNNVIMDKAGNILDFFFDKQMTTAPFVRLTLDARDDTGSHSADGITHFDGNTVSFTASLTAGSFATGDVVTVYREGESDALATRTITAVQNGVRQVVFEMPVSEFTVNTSFALEASLTRDDAEEGGRGMPLVVVYDTTAPQISIFDFVEGAAVSKVVNAFDDEGGVTIWRYAKIDGDVDCVAASLVRGTSAYSEYEDIILRPGDNGKKVCFASTDAAGNTGYTATSVIADIDATAPTVSVIALSGDRNFLKVTLSEPVYADTVPDISAFSLYRRSSKLTISSIEEMPASVGSASDTFVIRFTDSVAASDSLTLSYYRNGVTNKHIKDAAGNALQSFNRVSVVQPPSVVLELHPDDDTGSDSADGITAFDGPGVTFTVSTGSNAVFSDGDVITVYGGDDFSTVLASIVIGTDVSHTVGLRRFDTVIAARSFVEGENAVVATHRPDGATEEGNRGTVLTFHYDSIAPVITEKTAVVTPTHDTTPVYTFTAGETGALTYLNDCTAAAVAAVEGDNTIVFHALSDGTYADCALVMTDVAGNESSAFVISPFVIDTAAPVVTVESPEPGTATDKMVVARDDHDAETTFLYKIISGNSSCTASQVAVDAEAYIEDEDLTLSDEQYNGMRVCFASTDEAGNTGYMRSEVIAGIDTTGPGIVVQNPSVAYETRKAVSAKDDDTDTVWVYKVLVDMVAVCGEAQMTVGAVPYAEGTQIPFVEEDDNGKRVCFAVTDAAGNTVYAESAVVSNIDVTPPTVVSARTVDLHRSRTEVVLSEAVRMSSLPAARSFRIVIDGVEYPATDILDLSLSVDALRTSFTIAHPSVRHGSSVSLKFVNDTDAIVDRAGNVLDSFSDLAITAVQFVSLTLSADDDTGSADGITAFDGSDVTLDVSLSSGVFRNGDEVRVYRGSSVIGTYLVSNVLFGAVNASGSKSFVITLSQRQFTDNGVTVLHATYMPVDGVEGDPGFALSVTHDDTPPTITVSDPSLDFESRKVISAADDDDTAATVWMLKQIDASEHCERSVMQTDVLEYVEGEEVEFVSEDDNGTKVCFSSADVAGNVSYVSSEVLTNIDTTAPVISSATVTNISRTSTDVFFSEKVHASSTPSAGDFILIVGGVAHPASAISNLSDTLSGADMKITLTHSPVSEGVPVILRYIARNGVIVDRAGNRLESTVGQEQTVSNIPFVTIALDASDDTGPHNADGITSFNRDSSVVFSVSLTSGVFSEGDRVEIYRADAGVETLLKNVTVSSSGGFRSVNAHGQSMFTISLEKSAFAEGSVTLFAVHVPFGGVGSSNRGPVYSIAYDTTAPVIRIENPDTLPSRSKIVRADDNENAETFWTYKVIDSVSVCSASVMSGAVLYVEEDDLPPFADEMYNGKQVCFSVSDLAGNVSYLSSDILTGIDVTPPVVSSAVIVNLDRTRSRVLFSEPVYATSSAFSPSDFKILANNVPYSVTTIEDLPTDIASARDTFVLTHPAVSDQIAVSLSYVHGGQHRIVDTAGNMLERFSGQAVSSTSFVTLRLAAVDDTGLSDSDGVTTLVGSEVSIVVSLASGSVFSEGDAVVFYGRRDQTSVPNALKRVVVSSLLRDGVNAHGSAEFVITLPISVFPRNTSTLLSATYIPAGLLTNERGSEILVVRDTIAPVIDISVSVIEQTRVISAADRDSDTEESTWMYRQLSSDTTCGAVAMAADTKVYVEGEDLAFGVEDDNDTTVCFSASDTAGNTAYLASNVLAGIDTTVPTVSDLAITATDEITVTLSEPVYSVSGPDPDDFVIFVNGTAIYTTDVKGLANTANAAVDSFVIVSDEDFEVGDTVLLSYVGSSRSRDGELIRDSIGNVLAPFDQLSVAAPKTVTLSLAAVDDTGPFADDGHTNFGDDSTVSFIVALSDGVFSNGDTVSLYREGETSTLKTVRVGIRRGQADADGESSFVFEISKSRFTEGSFKALRFLRTASE